MIVSEITFQKAATNPTRLSGKHTDFVMGRSMRRARNFTRVSNCGEKMIIEDGVEIGDFGKWTSSSGEGTTQLYERTYVKIKPSYPCCAHCDKELKPDVWHIQINWKTYCSEECVLAEYDWIEPFFIASKAETKNV